MNKKPHSKDIGRQLSSPLRRRNSAEDGEKTASARGPARHNSSRRQRRAISRAQSMRSQASQTVDAPAEALDKTVDPATFLREWGITREEEVRPAALQTMFTRLRCERTGLATPGAAP